MFVYVGSYTEPPIGRAAGIRIFRFDPAGGSIDPVGTAGGVANPSFLALGPGRRHLYAASEVEEGAVVAFARDPASGGLAELNRQPSHGAGPCHLAPDPSGRFLLVANYGGGTVAALPLDPDGRLAPAASVVRHRGSGPIAARQEGPHPHMALPVRMPGGDAVLVADLGTDRVAIYRLGGDGKLMPNPDGPPFVATEPAAGPRHLAVSPDGRTVYVANELASTLTSYAYDGERGDLRPRQTVSLLPPGFRGENSGAHVAVAPDGRFVYASNRGHDSIAVYAVAAAGDLRLVGHEPTGGRCPRHFALDPSGTWLLAANQDGDTLTLFRRDPGSGTLAAAGEPIPTPAPVCILFAKA